MKMIQFSSFFVINYLQQQRVTSLLVNGGLDTLRIGHEEIITNNLLLGHGLSDEKKVILMEKIKQCERREQFLMFPINIFTFHNLGNYF